MHSILNWRFWLVALWMMGAGVGGVRGQSVRLGFGTPTTQGWQVIVGEGRTNGVHVLEHSADLTSWTEAAVFHDATFRYAAVDPSRGAARYFRALTRNRTASDDWKNQVALPADAFANEEPNPFTTDPAPRWIKFMLLLPDPTRVYFQDSAKYAFHFDFASRRLAEFRGMNRAAFDAATLVRTGQRAVLGALLLPGDALVPEYGIQFAGNEPYTREEVASWFGLVREAIRHDIPAAKALYVPAFEQAEVAEREVEWFRQRGIELGAATRWQFGDVCYSEGWALGRLVFVPADQIEVAYRTGRLAPGDILLTDGVPAEVPFVAGIVTLEPATPNSHSVILARSFGIPMVYPADAMARAALMALDGLEVVLRVGGDYRCDFKALGVQGTLAEDVRRELERLKQPPELKFAAKESFGAVSTNAAGLRLADTRYFGGKASNFGLLRRIIPGNSPDPAIAMSFDLWEGFLDQTLTNGKTLREELAARLAGFGYPPNMAALSTQLFQIRDLIRKEARFGAGQKTAVLDALAAAGFDPARKIRFRSSTNVEDSERFTGAGLYDSYSGCAADDLDADETGPSRCDATEPEERGVFRALQRVYASFYNDNAVLERLRFGVKDEKVGMAVLVHYSFPDSAELANGVATLKWRKDGTSRSYEMHLVTQLGAVSVTNPDGAAIPEEVDGYLFTPFGGDPVVVVRKGSSLVPLGSKVMNWESDYQNLFSLLVKVANAYALQVPTRSELLLDFEFKKMAPGKLEVKQVRSIPLPDRNAVFTTALINEPIEYEVFQGEFGDVFSNHRLKSILRLETRDRLLTPAGLATSLYSRARFEFRRGSERVVWLDGFESWPAFKHRSETDAAIDEWTDSEGPEVRRFQLRTEVIRQVSPPRSPIVTQDDFMQVLSATYSVPQVTIGFEGVGKTSSDTVRLVRRGSIVPAGAPRVHEIRKGTHRIRTSYQWPEPPRGAVAGYTAPLAKWVETRLEGWTTEPLILRGEWSQTYHPFHHNFSNEFLFEPGLDPGVSAAQLEQLKAANVRMVYMVDDGSSPTVLVIGWDGTAKTVP